MALLLGGHLLTQLRIAKVHPILLLSTCSTSGDRLSSINTNINYVDVSARLCCQHTHAGCSTGHIFSLYGCHFLWRNSDPFLPDAVIGTHNQYRFFAHMRYAIQPRHSCQLYGKRLQLSQATNRFE